MNRIDPDGKETVIIVVQDGKVGHIAMWIENKIHYKFDSPVFYGPMGSYFPRDKESKRSLEGDYITGTSANIVPYIKYWNRQGEKENEYEIYKYDTTPDEEKKLIDNMLKVGGGHVGFLGGGEGPPNHCSIAVGKVVENEERFQFKFTIKNVLMRLISQDQMMVGDFTPTTFNLYLEYTDYKEKKVINGKDLYDRSKEKKKKNEKKEK